MTAVWESVWNHLTQADVALATPCRFIYEYEGSDLGDQRSFTPLEALRQFELFQPFPDDIKQALSARLRMYRLAPNTRIMKEGDSGDSMFIIAEGAMGIWITLEDGSSLEVARRGPGDIIGEMALLTGEARTASVISISPAVAYEVTKEDIAPYLQQQPEIAESLSEILTKRKLETSQAKDAHRSQEDEARGLSRQFLSKIQNFFGLAAKKELEISPLEVIQQVDLFQTFAESTKTMLSQKMKQHRAKTDETIVEQGEQGDSLFFIASGEVGVWVTLDNGEHLRVAQMEAGTFFGDNGVASGIEIVLNCLDLSGKLYRTVSVGVPIHHKRLIDTQSMGILGH
jgi:CRP-like cAMP-binding protein